MKKKPETDAHHPVASRGILVAAQSAASAAEGKMRTSTSTHRSAVVAVVANMHTTAARAKNYTSNTDRNSVRTIARKRLGSKQQQYYHLRDQQPEQRQVLEHYCYPALAVMLKEAVEGEALQLLTKAKAEPRQTSTYQALAALHLLPDGQQLQLQAEVAVVFLEKRRPLKQHVETQLALPQA